MVLKSAAGILLMCQWWYLRSYGDLDAIVLWSVRSGVRVPSDLELIVAWRRAVPVYLYTSLARCYKNGYVRLVVTSKTCASELSCVGCGDVCGWHVHSRLTTKTDDELLLSGRNGLLQVAALD